MPELPEVETVMQGLTPFLMHRSLHHVDVRSPALREPIPVDLLHAVCGRKIVNISRRAKYILVDFEGGDTLVIHLGMTGSVTVHLPDKTTSLELDRHDHLVLRTDENIVLVYRDPRRFGVIDVIRSADKNTSKAFIHLGSEPLEDAFTAQVLYAKIRTRHAAIKPVIMDQKMVVGVGNIYASEALYLSGIDPHTPASALSLEKCMCLVDNIKHVLRAAIESGGSTLRDYRKVGGERGYFQFHFSVYDKAGQACPDCTCSLTKTGGIQRSVQAGRSTFYCPVRQK